MEFFTWSRDWLIQHADGVNLAAVIIVLIPGLAVLTLRPAPLKQHEVARHAMRFWVLQWLVFVFVYFIRESAGGFPLWTEIFLVDVHTILLLGLCIALFKGDEFRWDKTWVNLMILILIALAWNWVLGTTLAVEGAGSALRYLWIVPSALLSMAGLFLFGEVFLRRYGWLALPVAVACGFYALLQWPIYTSVIVKMSSDARWFLALAAGKLLWGGLFYLYFLTPLESYRPLVVKELDPELLDRLLARGKKLGGVLAGFATAVLASLVAGWLLRVRPPE